jgi:hypothetical protein
MTPEELSKLHPRLYHVTAAGAARTILDRGLLSTKEILERWEIPASSRSHLMTRRRSEAVQLDHPVHGRIVLNDNAPLNERKLANVLDDGLTPARWLEMLNSRVFFFATEKPLRQLIGARLNRHLAKDVLTLDTDRLARAYGEVMEIVPINSGNTNYAAARRGYATFASLLEADYRSWQRCRGNKSPDSIKEVSIRGSISNISEFVLEVTEGAGSRD